MKCIDFAFQFLFADLIYGKYWNWVTNEQFLCWKFYEWNISCLFFFNCQDILPIFYHISDSLQISSTLKPICFKMQGKKTFFSCSVYISYRNPPIKQTCWQWLAEAQLFETPVDTALITRVLSMHFCRLKNIRAASIKFKEFNILKLLPVNVLTNVHESVIGSIFFEMGEMDMPQFSLAFER